MTKRMKSRDDSWVDRVMRNNGCLIVGAQLQPYGRVALVKEATRWCSYSSSLAPEHCKVMHTQLTKMAADFPGAEVELGMYERLDLRKNGHPVAWAWPYAALAMRQGSRIDHGFMLVPCAPACSRIMAMGIPLGDGTKLRIEMPNMFGDLVPVTQDVDGTGVVFVEPSGIASREMVRRGDAFLLDLANVVRVKTRGTASLGPAARFGSMDEMIDAARCRLAFAQLPMA